MGRLIDKIESPADLKKLSPADLYLVADELRDEILRTVSVNGGHLASSLGTVELTVALHYIFDAPNDLIIWDVGHQAYSHKLLTGRKDAFHTLRKMRGISGFPRREESPYDCYGNGHASASISAALGIAEALAKKGEKHRRVIAVIGDGGMTGGMAFEALNHAGHLGRDLIVILNDNEMSIHPNVGALSSFLSRKMTTSLITKMMAAGKEFLRSLPQVGDRAFKYAKRFKDALKNFLSPGYLFEGLGFTYVGPINGHKIDELLETFRNVKDLRDVPVLIHVRTQKGKGYEPAEREPVIFHGVGPFDRRTGKLKKDKSGGMSYTRVFSDAMIELASQDERIVAITAAMPNGTGLDRFQEKFPDRCYDVGIAEQHAVGFAAGLATQGLKPVVAIYSTFLQRAYDQIIHDVCLQNLPVLFALDRGGLVGADGPTHHGVFDLGYLRSIPNMVVMAPRNEEELRRMLATGLSLNCPSAVRYPRGNAEGVAVTSPIKPLEVGKGELIHEGNDILFVAIGICSNIALSAAYILEARGVDAGVIDARFVKPLDKILISRWAERVGTVITVEENVTAGGFGSAVAEMLEEIGLNVRLKRIGIPDMFIEHGEPQELRSVVGLTSESLAQTALEMLGSKKPELRSLHRLY